MNSPKDKMQVFTIRETAKLTGLPESTLRYYETIGLIHPITRDSSSKHRVYNEDDVNRVIAVACLSATGMSIDDMRAYLTNRALGTKAALEQVELLENQKTTLAEEAKSLALRRKYVDIKIAYWKAVKSGNSKQIEITKHQANAIAKELKLPKTVSKQEANDRN